MYIRTYEFIIKHNCDDVIASVITLGIECFDLQHESKHVRIIFDLSHRSGVYQYKGLIDKSIAVHLIV